MDGRASGVVQADAVVTDLAEGIIIPGKRNGRDAVAAVVGEALHLPDRCRRVVIGVATREGPANVLDLVHAVAGGDIKESLLEAHLAGVG